MLSKAKTLTGYNLKGLDGEVGKVSDFYFDVEKWAVRYLVADTGTWLRTRQILISPHAITAVNEPNRRIDLNLTKKQIEESPPLEQSQPVSQQYEASYHMYFGWPGYWCGSNTYGVYPFIMPSAYPDGKLSKNEADRDPHLQSAEDVRGHHVQADDGEIGHIEDLVIDEETWMIRYFVVDTRNWWPGRKVLISPSWIDRISWEESKIFVTVTREQVKQSPEYSEATLIRRDYEVHLHQHYFSHGYWGEDPAPKERVH
jgi:uncharacterized protein YrrD